MLTLPEPVSERPPAFTDRAGAKAWLGAQPQAQPLLMQAALNEQVNALDAARLPPQIAVELLNVLHSAILPAQASLETCFSRKPLPMPKEEERIFVATQKLWLRTGIAYLRLAPHFSPKDKTPLLFRAANAFRMAEFAHFMACRECPTQLDHLLFSVLIQANSSGILRQTHLDRDFRHLGEANIAGIIIWALLLRLINPFHMTAAQLTVANRALSRWRELCHFQTDAESSARAPDIPLTERFAIELPEGIPRYLNIQPIVRKLRSRVVSLRAGASPESLKLGRELSATACIRLLDDIEQQLRPPRPPPVSESREIALVFGPQDAYAVFREEKLNPEAAMDIQSESLANQRMALFGFDKVSRMPTAVQKLEIPYESWRLTSDGKAVRQAAAGSRRMTPCLIATHHAGRAQLGVLRGLLSDTAGTLTADPDWYPESIEACRLQQPGLRENGQAKFAAFLITGDDRQPSLLLPSNAPIRPGTGVALEGNFVHHLVPTEVIERGIDFVRYACRQG